MSSGFISCSSLVLLADATQSHWLSNLLNGSDVIEILDEKFDLYTTSYLDIPHTKIFLSFYKWKDKKTIKNNLRFTLDSEWVVYSVVV